MEGLRSKVISRGRVQVGTVAAGAVGLQLAVNINLIQI